MGLETGTWVDDLVITNPPGGDDKRQGDDHLRLIKATLRNTLRRATKAFFLPGSVSKSANYTVLESDENLTIQCDTTTTFNLTLPVLDITRAGWQIFVVKMSTDMNPVYLVPSSGTINGFAKVRRSAAMAITQVLWTGAAWVASRHLGSPVGSVTEYYGSSLPQGHLWADGSTFTAADYVELNTTLGGNTKPDRRGRVSVGRDDMGGGAAGRVTAAISGITGTTLLSAGGTQSVTLDTTMIPAHAHSVLSTASGGSLTVTGHSHVWGNSISLAAGRFTTAGSLASGYNLDHTHSQDTTTASGSELRTPGTGGTFFGHTAEPTGGSGSLDHAHIVDVGGTTSGASDSISGSTQNSTGGGSAHNNMPPSIVCNAIVVAE